MLLKYFYDEKLAHASYLVGCQKTGEAVVVDPGRDIQPYLDAARREGLDITAVAETHIHADYVSGARELAERVGAKLYVSDEGPAEWKYQYWQPYRSQLLKNQDRFEIGNLEFQVLHTPGHTPESISFLLTDRGGGADQAMGIFTGDFIFVNSIGRPDLLEEAAGMQGTAEPGARDLFRSVEKFRQLPDYLQVWPAHGAGSACGKGLGAIPSSTVGYEIRFNPALQIQDEQQFVKYILSEQPEAPPYFALMKRVNKEGPAVIGPDARVPLRPEAELTTALKAGQVVDIGSTAAFAEAHVPGSWNIPLGSLAAWAGWLLDYNEPVYLIGMEKQIPEALRTLQAIGVDEVAGYFDDHAVRSAGLKSQAFPNRRPEELQADIEAGNVMLIDVRSASEWSSGRIPQARHMFLGRLPQNLNELKSATSVVTQCRGGGRSVIAASLLQAAGIPVTNLQGGMLAWQRAGLPTAESTNDCGTTTSCATR